MTILVTLYIISNFITFCVIFDNYWYGNYIWLHSRNHCHIAHRTLLAFVCAFPHFQPSVTRCCAAHFYKQFAKW